MVTGRSLPDPAARSQIYAFLATAFMAPDESSDQHLRAMLPMAEAAAAALGASQCAAALAELGDELGRADVAERARAHRRVFGHLVSGDCPPYEAEYGNSHIFQKTHCLADHAGFLEAFGLSPAPGFNERLDHIAIELEFMQALAAKEAYAAIHGHGEERLAVVREAARRYLREHLARWAPVFATRLESKAGKGSYAALARLLAAFIEAERLAFDVPAENAAAAPAAWQPDAAAGCEGCAVAVASASPLGGVP